MAELLEYLREKAGCLYLSDLRTQDFRERALEAALALPPDAYPFDQWQEAARYLLSRDDLGTVDQVRRALEDRQRQI